jgi:hypothetical protein
MKRLFEWWHSYRLIVMTLKGVTALLNNSKYNKKLNTFNFAGFKYTDGWDDAMMIANNLDGDVAAQVLNEAWARMRAAQAGHVHDDHPHEHAPVSGLRSEEEVQQFAEEHAGIMGYPEQEKKDG